MTQFLQTAQHSSTHTRGFVFQTKQKMKNCSYYVPAPTRTDIHTENRLRLTVRIIKSISSLFRIESPKRFSVVHSVCLSKIYIYICVASVHLLFGTHVSSVQRNVPSIAIVVHIRTHRTKPTHSFSLIHQQALAHTQRNVTCNWDKNQSRKHRTVIFQTTRFGD